MATPPGDFREGAREQREAAEERGAPETGAGALPADADAPEFSRGEPLDDPQPSAPRKDELESAEDQEDKRDTESPDAQI